MKKSFSFNLFALTLGLFTFSFSPLFASNFSLNVDGEYSRHFDLTTNDFSHNGFGGAISAEFSPIDLLAIGVGFSGADYFGLSSAGYKTTALDGILRLTPWSGQIVSPYLIAGFGINPFGTTEPAIWPNKLDGFGGAGLRVFVTPQWAVDFGATYNYFDPSSNPLSAINARAGLSFFFSPAIKDLTQFASITTGESIKDVAAREYGDPNLYPILIDANYKDKTKPFFMPSEANMIIPKNPSKETIANARAEARLPEYINIAATAMSPVANAQYRSETQSTEDLANIQEESRSGKQVIEGTNRVPTTPVSKEKRTAYVYHSDNLWSIAARPDVYGDPELYSLLVDANFSKFSTPLILTPNTELIIPRELTKEMIRKARMKSWSPEYMRWRGVDMTRKEYERWRKAHGLAPENTNVEGAEDAGQ